MPDRRRSYAPWLLGALLLLFAAGVTQLQLWQVEEGNLYASYSSLRSDPLGTRVLFESLRRQPGLTVAQNYEPLTKLPATPAALWYFTSYSSWGNEELFRAADRLTAAGGRIIVAFAPVPFLVETQEHHQVATPFETQWKLRLRPRMVPRRQHLAANETALEITPLDPAWHLIAAPAMVWERPWQRGTLVVVGNAYPLSNEGLWKQRDAATISAIAGAPTQLVFDEQHLGTHEDPGVMQLARRYGLTWPLLVLLALAALYLWQNSVSFLPAYPALTTDAVTGKDARAGLANLLRRSLPPSQLTATLWQEWTRSKPRVHPEVLAEMQPNQPDPLTAYQLWWRALQQRRGKPNL